MGAQVTPLSVSSFKHIVFLTGAGISVASGLRPFRGPGGLWEEGEFLRVADIDFLREQPHEARKFHAWLREACLKAEPNPAHQAMADFQKAWGKDREITLITQNVDGLHQKAGSEGVVEFHGNALHSQCMKCNRPPFRDDRLYDGTLPVCELCGGLIRPAVVLFGEAIPTDALVATQRAIRKCDLFIAVGTSGTVSPASELVRTAQYGGAKTLLVNLEAMSPPNRAFQREILGKAEEILPELLAARP